MSTTGTERLRRETVFAPRIEHLLRSYRGAEAFRLDESTVGIAGADLMNAVLAARPANEFERPTFKPLQGRKIGRPEASAVMRAVGQDVRTALKTPTDTPVDLTGEWPQVGHRYLRDLVFGADPYRLRVLVDRTLELTPKITWSVIAAGATLPVPPAGRPPLSELAGLVSSATGYEGRRHAMGMYRRAAAPVCFTVSALVTNALWLGAPFATDTPNEHILLESLRLLPVSWNLLRVADAEFTALDDRIGLADDVLMLPLLSHRDPSHWEDPDVFRPERWATADPDTHPGYLPFGHVGERCWGRHMVMPLAERLLDLIRRDGLTVDPGQTSAKVPLAGLMGATGVRVVRG
ncbi:cytochrome P450 [Streptomyces tsukubensis]|uniref:Cytochrome n=1 Tax=Streptomyces tsukubensis TaxID=83656 RepID=A0A1V4A3E7_9ACTN|nr:cytochrome P450 [Streptomyces tsukubensis]OON73865.1 cytochrome [Streptomyces tsukubensis]QFR91762.1 cytochrome P450 [Streptomyces tsukubensis]